MSKVGARLKSFRRRRRLFSLAVVSRPGEKHLPLCPLCLCGKFTIRNSLFMFQINDLDAIICIRVFGRWSCRQNNEVTIYPVQPQPFTSEVVPDLRWIRLKDRIYAIREDELSADPLFRAYSSYPYRQSKSGNASRCSTGQTRHQNQCRRNTLNNGFNAHG